MGNIIDNVRAILENRKTRSAWDRGVNAYAIDLLDNLRDVSEDDLQSSALVEKHLLDGADSWDQYSWGGCAYCYDGDIAKTLCTPSELKKTRNGERRPNSQEEWLDVQARALYQACNRVKRAVRLEVLKQN